MKITIEVPDDLIESYVNRSRAAVGYWCSSWKNLDHGAILKCHDDDVAYMFSKAKLREALVVMAERYPHKLAEILGDKGDKYTGDLLVQLACFGEERYV